MSKKFKGVAEIELYNTKTKEVRKYEEHNMLTSLLDDVFESNNLDGCISYDTNIRNYLNQLVLFGANMDDSTDCVKDDVDIIATKTVDAAGTEYKNGIEYIFDFAEDEAIGAIECLSLAPSTFKELNGQRYSYTAFVNGFTSYTVKDKNFRNIVDVDFENGYIYTLTHDDYVTYEIGNEFYVKLNKYKHDFNRISIVKNENLNYKLVESTNIEVSSLFEGLTINPFTTLGYGSCNVGVLGYSVDSQNKKLIITYMCLNNKSWFRNIVVSLEDMSIVSTYKMIIPEYCKISYPFYFSDNGSQAGENICGEDFFKLTIYKGKINFLGRINNAENQIIGINYTDSTDITAYESKIDYGSFLSSAQLINYDSDTCISRYLIIKNNKAYQGIGDNFDNGFFYKSKVITITKPHDELDFSYRLCHHVVSTINHLTKTIIKSADETMKITYRITQSE